MEIGDVISKDDVLYVVTEMVNGEVMCMERLNDFIARIIVINHNGEHRTVKDIIDMYCDEYLSNRDIKFI